MADFSITDFEQSLLNYAWSKNVKYVPPSMVFAKLMEEPGVQDYIREHGKLVQESGIDPEKLLAVLLEHLDADIKSSGHIWVGNPNDPNNAILPHERKVLDGSESEISPQDFTTMVRIDKESLDVLRDFKTKQAVTSQKITAQDLFVALLTEKNRVIAPAAFVAVGISIQDRIGIPARGNPKFLAPVQAKADVKASDTLSQLLSGLPVRANNPDALADALEHPRVRAALTGMFADALRQVMSEATEQGAGNS